jgi:hypothetical protein
MSLNVLKITRIAARAAANPRAHFTLTRAEIQACNFSLDKRYVAHIIVDDALRRDQGRHLRFVVATVKGAARTAWRTP